MLCSPSYRIFFWWWIWCYSYCDSGRHEFVRCCLDRDGILSRKKRNDSYRGWTLGC